MKGDGTVTQFKLPNVCIIDGWIMERCVNVILYNHKKYGVMMKPLSC